MIIRRARWNTPRLWPRRVCVAPGIDERCGSQLSDAVELLELLLLNDGKERPGNVDVLPDRIAYRFRVVVFQMMEDAVGFVHAAFGRI